MFADLLRPSAMAATLIATILTATPALADCTPGQCWGALAAGLYEYDGGSRVSVGSSINAGSAQEAASNAVRQCQSNGITCRVVDTFTGCGYITTGGGNGNGRSGWGSGSTAQEAYNNCYYQDGIAQCDTDTIGGCNDN